MFVTQLSCFGALMIAILQLPNHHSTCRHINRKVVNGLCVSPTVMFIATVCFDGDVAKTCSEPLNVREHLMA